MNVPRIGEERVVIEGFWIRDNEGEEVEIEAEMAAISYSSSSSLDLQELQASEMETSIPSWGFQFVFLYKSIHDFWLDD